MPQLPVQLKSCESMVGPVGGDKQCSDATTMMVRVIVVMMMMVVAAVVVVVAQ